MEDEVPSYADENFVVANGIRLKKSYVKYIVGEYREENSELIDDVVEGELARIVESPNLLASCSMMEDIKHIFVRYVGSDD